jgi:hypothetical protein
MRSRRKTPDLQAEERAAREARAPARLRHAAAEATSPAHARRVARNVEAHQTGAEGRAEKGVRSRSWRQAKRADDNAPAARRRGVEPDAVPPTAEELQPDVLATCQDGLGLDDTELARLFDVDVPAVTQWRRHGVPAAHMDMLRRLGEVHDRLDAHRRVGHAAELVRTPFPTIGGRTLLDVLGDGDADITRTLDDALASGVPAMDLRGGAGRTRVTSRA